MAEEVQSFREGEAAGVAVATAVVIGNNAGSGMILILVVIEGVVVSRVDVS